MSNYHRQDIRILSQIHFFNPGNITEGIIVATKLFLLNSFAKGSHNLGAITKNLGVFYSTNISLIS